MKLFKQVYQYGMETRNSFGDLEIKVIVDGELQIFIFEEGSHPASVQQFVDELRREINGGAQ